MFGATNGVDIVIRAVDSFTAPLSRILGTTKTSVNGLDAIGNLASNGLVGKALFGLGLSTTVAGLAAITAGVSLLTRELQKAADVEVGVVAKASDMSLYNGKGIKQSKGIYEEVEQAIAKAAGPLPGTTSDYTAIFNQLVPAIAATTKGDTEEFKAIGLDMSTRIGVLAKSAGADASMGGSAVNRAVMGTSTLGEIRQIDIFQKSGAFQDAIGQGLRSIGADEGQWKSLGKDVRLKIVTDALKVATPDALITELQTTASAVTEGWMSSLFDPIVGQFGVRRDVASRGKSAFDAYSGLIQSVNYMFGAINRATGGNGKVDFMGKVIDFIDWLAGITNSISRALDSASTLFGVEKLGEGIGKFIGSAIGYLPELFLKIGIFLFKGFVALGPLILGIFVGYFKGFFKTMLVSSRDIAGLIVDFFKDLLRMVADAVKMPFVAAKNATSGFFGGVKDVLNRPLLGGDPAKANTLVQPGVDKAGNPVNVSIGAINSNASDPKAVANETLALIQARVAERRQMILATP